jgi:hypothetical protein
MAFRIRGELDVSGIARALSLIVERHEILRTTFAIEDGEPVQRILSSTAVTVPVEDLRSAVADREQRFHDRVSEEARRPFDLGAEPLLRARAFRLDEADWGLVMVSHHLATDGWGARLLLDELSGAYGAFAEGREPDLPRLPLQYGDYSAWEVERSDGGELESQRRYWVDRLAGAPRQLRLPFDFPPTDSVATNSVKVSFSPDCSEELRQLSRARGVTPYVTLLAAFNALLHQYTEQSDIVVGTILSRRTRSETEPLIGNFGNNLLLRTTVDGDSSLDQVIERTAATMRDALARSDVPLELVAQAAPIPAFHVMFILRDGNYAERLTFPGLTVEAVLASSGAATVDLSLDLTDGSRGIEGYFEYRTGRFARETIDRLGESFANVVARLVEEPPARVGSLQPVRVDHQRSGGGRQRHGEEPVTPTERALAQLWREWLEIETVYRGDNFFDVGGDSLRAVYVLERTERELGYRFRPEDMSRLTLADQAALIDGGAPSGVTVVAESESGFAVRRVNPSEFGNEIKKLFEREQQHHLVEFFDRAYPDGAKAGMASWITTDAAGRLIGHIAVFPHRFTCDGVDYMGALGANLVMDSRHRNLANAMALVQTMARDLESDGDVDFLFGDPNEEGRAVMSSVGGFTDLGVLTRFALPVTQPGLLGPAVAAYLRLKFRRAQAVSFEVERRSAAVFDVGEVEVPPGQSTALRPIHSSQLLRRRLTGYPTEGDEWYLFARGSARVAAVLVRTFHSGSLAQLCCIWREPSVPLVQLVWPIVSALRAAGVRRVQASSLLESSLGRELRAAGFRPREHAGRFIALPLSARGRALLERKVDWEITDLDCDRGLDR